MTLLSTELILSLVLAQIMNIDAPTNYETVKEQMLKKFEDVRCKQPKTYTAKCI